MKSIIALSPASLPRTGEIQMDATVLLFSFLISLLSGVLFGFMPALHIAREGLTEELKGSGEGASDGSRVYCANRLHHIRASTSITLRATDKLSIE